MLVTKYDATVINVKVDTSIYDLNMDFYINNLTIGANRSFSDNDINNQRAIFVGSGDSSAISLVYYLGINVKLSISLGSMDLDKVNSFSAGILPNFFNRKASIVLEYIDIRGDNQIGININYYFDDEVSFKNRDRHY